MCGRYTLKTPSAELAEFFGTAFPPHSPRYNIAPTQDVLTIRQNEGGPHAALLRWGLVPGWSKDVAIGNKLINARAETVAEKPSFRSAFRSRRCLVVADGFYEWQKLAAGGKRPVYFTLEDGGPFAFAGLWERWTSPDGTPLETCCLITTAANALVQPAHDRMPVILPPERHAKWLDPGNDGRNLPGLLVPYPPEEMSARPVSNAVNSPKNDGPGLVEPAEGTAD